MDQKIFVQNIRRELGKKLPGQTYQYQMAPDDRRLQNLVKVGKPKDAAVLILLSSFHNGPELVFIKRTLYPGPHSGQISFPGGKADPSDPDLEYTALRETQEEIGVPSKQIRIIGSLTPLEIPVSHFKVHPFIGIGDGISHFSIQKEEVQFLLFERLEVLIDPANLATMEVMIQNKPVHVPCYRVGEHRIWGATAMILSEFLEVIRRAGLINSKL